MRTFLSCVLLVATAGATTAQPARLKVLFLGDDGHHQPAARFRQLQPVLAVRGIDLIYTDRLADLDPRTLSSYDALLIYANHPKISPEQEAALLGFVEGGKGLVALHCASYCFLNSAKYVELVGAQFRSHETGTFRPEVVAPDHPLMRGYHPFASWDETYVHTKHHEKDRVVLEVRVQGDHREPWTWVRTQGKGRVFYTAWGHDHRTWGHDGFHNLVERGIRWVCGQDPARAGTYFDRPQMNPPRSDVRPFEYVAAKVPFYPPRGQRAGPLDRMQKPLTPEESLKHLVTPVGFEPRLFVAEDRLDGKPIAMAWDERGRLWLALTRDYPNDLQPPGRGNDRIVVCEDGDGDGVCDRVITFADKLSIPTSLLPYAGGLIVHQAPVTLFLKDTDGDGRADVRQVLFSGWGTGDTHAGPSNLRYGFDNWVYGAVGYAGFAGTVAGEAHHFRQGFYRFKLEPNRGPDAAANPLKVTRLEFLRSTSNNTWGLNFDETGEAFGSTANGCPIVHLGVPNRYYEKVRGLAPGVLANIAPDFRFEPVTDKVRQVDWHGGYTAASHLAVYTARTYPPEYWNRTAFISDPTGHLTGIFALRPAGTTFQARYAGNLLASDDEWTAPIDAQVGPDGHVWVIDWYNFIVQHNPTPAGYTTGRGNAYETPLRDKTHGRVYRVVYTRAAPQPRTDLGDAPADKLVQTLRHPNLLWRLHAQRLLVERARDDVVPELVRLAADPQGDETGNTPGALHALWTLAGLGVVERSDPAAAAGQAVLQALTHPAAPVRAAAYAILPRRDEWFARIPEAALAEADPRVRQAALLALSEVPPGPGADRLAAALFRTATAAEADSPALLAAVAGHSRGLLTAAPTLPESPTLLPVIESAARSFATGTDRSGLDVILSSLGRARPAVAARVVAGLADGWPANEPARLSPDAARAVVALLDTLPAAEAPRLLKLAARWNLPGLEDRIDQAVTAAAATLTDPRAADDQRTTAARLLTDLRPGDPRVLRALLDTLAAGPPPSVAAAVLDRLGSGAVPGAGVALVGRLRDLPPAVRPAAVQLVLTRTESAKAFLDAVEAGTLRFDLLALDQKTALAAHPDANIRERARKLLAQGGGLPNPDRQKVIDELKPLLAKTFDPVNGKKVFLHHCAKCHQHSGEGVAIGPDLTGFAVHPKEELLVHILDPSRSVEGNYKLYRVITADDRTLLGILGATTATTVEVIDSEARRHVLVKDEIVSLTETDKSLMPEGFEKVMRPEELGDLLEFLTQKGRFVPLPLDRVATVVSTRDMFFDAGGQVERLIFPDWKPKTFDGVPFVLVDPQGERVKNVVLLYGPNGRVPPRMPRSVSLPYAGKAKAVHLLSGVSGWGWLGQGRPPRTVSLIVRLTYEDGRTEDHELLDGVHFADYIRRVDVPGSKFAFTLRQQQIRYLAVEVKRPDVPLRSIEFVKGPDHTAPVIMAVTVETP